MLLQKNILAKRPRKCEQNHLFNTLIFQDNVYVHEPIKINSI